MTVQLARYSFPDDPTWIIMSEDVPLGTRYEVIGYNANMTLVNLYTNRKRQVECYMVRNSKDTGWIPCVVFEACND